MDQSCISCGTSFEVSEKEQAFLQAVSPVIAGKRYDIPLPTHCHDCKHQRRCAQRNERKLYRRTCGLTGASIVSFYHQDSPFVVYDHDAWWSDGWDPMQYGRDIDLNRSFFEQFQELRLATPRQGMMVSLCENCTYAPYSFTSKNCYMCVSCCESEDLYHCFQVNQSKDCVDCCITYASELCYECLYCVGLFNCAYCKDCENCNDSFFCEDCRGCKNCIGCINLVNQEYCIFNQPVSKEEYEEAKAALGSHTQREQWRQKAEAFFAQQITRSDHLIQCENVTGDHLQECRNCEHCFDARNLEDCAYVYTCPVDTKDSQDMNYSPKAELLYDCMSSVGGYASRFVLHSWENKDVFYTDECYNSEQLFGCVGLRQKKYCILNKQYMQQEYEDLVPKIIERMTIDKEWGEYIPMQMSPFAYNETIAQTHFPITKEQALERGLRWSDEKPEVPNVTKVIPGSKLPEGIADVPDDVLNWAITCEATEHPFKLSKQELAFYRNQNIPVPHVHPDERYERRMARSNKRTLFERTCAQCDKQIQTTYEDASLKVLCEECYLKEVY